MKFFTLVIVLSAALATAILVFIAMDQPFTLATLGFIAWAVSPYVFFGILTKLLTQNRAIKIAFVVSILVAAFGIWAIVDAMFIHLDAQGGLIFIFAPLYQWVAVLIAAIPVYLLNDKN